jgi:hypothetical protein
LTVDTVHVHGSYIANCCEYNGKRVNNPHTNIYILHGAGSTWTKLLMLTFASWLVGEEEFLSGFAELAGFIDNQRRISWCGVKGFFGKDKFS